MRKVATVFRPVLIGVAHDLPKVEQITPEDWDVRLDMVVTDQSIYRYVNILGYARIPLRRTAPLSGPHAVGDDGFSSHPSVRSGRRIGDNL